MISEKETFIDLTAEQLSYMEISKVLKDNLKELQSIEFSYNGQYIVTSDGMVINMYDTITGKQYIQPIKFVNRRLRTIYNRHEEFKFVKISFQNCIYYAKSVEPYYIQCLPFYERDPQTIFTGPTDQIISMDVHPLAPYLMATSLDFQLRIWNLQTQKIESQINLTKDQTLLICAFNPSKLAFAIGTFKSELPSNIAMYFYDKQKYNEIGYELQWKENYQLTSSLKYSPNGEWILMISQSKQYVLIDESNGSKVNEQNILQKNLFENEVYEPNFTPNSKFLIIGSQTGHIYLIDARVGTVVLKFEGHLYDCRIVKFSPQYAFMVSACKNLCFWAPAKIVLQKKKTNDFHKIEPH